MSIENNLKIILIDFEYAGWNPMAMDVAVLINETMNHNSYPFKNGVEWYLENLMSDQEQNTVIREYLTHYYVNYMPKDQISAFGGTLETFLEANFEGFRM